MRVPLTRQYVDTRSELFVRTRTVHVSVRLTLSYTGTRTGLIVGVPGLGSFGLGFNRLGGVRVYTDGGLFIQLGWGPFRCGASGI